MTGYRAMLLLILGLFKICAGNYAFRDRISEEFQEKDGKKLLKDIKNWIKDVSSNLNMMIRTSRLGYWRKSDQKLINYQTLNFYLENEDKINSEKCLAALNAIVEKHNGFFNSG